MEIFRKTKKTKTNKLFSLGRRGGWGGRIKQNGNDWKSQSYKGTNLGYNILCESADYDQEEK